MLIKSLAAVVLLLVVLLIYTSYSIQFNRDDWAQSDLVTKYRMARDIESRNLLLGKTSTEVVGLLGEPDQKSADRFFYQIDQPYGFYDGLTVVFENGASVSAYVHD